MTQGITPNKSYNSAYIIAPLQKTHNGLTVESQTPANQDNLFESTLNNLNDIKSADTNHDNIISLEELKNYPSKTEFMDALIKSMEEFNSNALKDYSNSIFFDQRI